MILIDYINDGHLDDAIEFIKDPYNFDPNKEQKQENF